jgi:hypothetical protein
MIWSPGTIAAAIPLAVLAMLEGLKGDAGEVTRLAAQAAAEDGTLEPAGQLPQASTVRRGDPATSQYHATGTISPGRRALPARPAEPTAKGTVGARLQAAYAQPRPDGQPWTARTLWPRPPAVAAAAPPASCNATAPRPRRTPGEVVALAVARRRRWLCLPRHPRPALHYPSPTAAASSRFPATTRLRPGPAARVGIRAAARSPSTPWVAWSPTGSGMPPVTGPAS